MKAIVFKAQRGFTLVEMIVYVAVLAIITTVAVLFFVQIVNLTETSRRARESIDNAQRAMEVITQEIKHAKSVYTPTSLMDTNPGQLSLETTRDLPADELTTYVDLYLDGGGIYIKREGQSPQLVTSQKIKVTNLVFTLLTDAAGRSSVKTNLTVEYKDPISGPKNAVSLTSTTSLRSYE